MLDSILFEQVPAFFQIRDDIFVGVFNTLALIIRNFSREHTIIIDRIHKGDTGLRASIVILFTKSWCHMNNTSTTVSSNVIRRNNSERTFISTITKVREQRFVSQIDKVFSLHHLQNFNFIFMFLKHRWQQCLRQDQFATCRFFLNLDVIHIKTDCQS
ncbi:hypothetical protein D3C72_1724080 [compost metagenome]